MDNNNLKDLMVKGVSSILIAIMAFGLLAVAFIFVVLMTFGVFSAIIAIILYTIDLILGTSYFYLPYILIAGALATVLKIIFHKSEKRSKLD